MQNVHNSHQLKFLNKCFHDSKIRKYKRHVVKNVALTVSFIFSDPILLTGSHGVVSWALFFYKIVCIRAHVCKFSLLFYKVEA